MTGPARGCCASWRLSAPVADRGGQRDNVAGSGWGASVLGLSVVALAIAFRRWRHLAVFVGGLLFLDHFGTQIYYGLSRPRP